ncbi:MAG: hypothetical protein IJL77_03945 [Clostridia bacterium]|nr:hypothetical protein [Clostridia bacterium]
MKKLLAILLTLAMVAAFAACGSKTEDETTTTEPTSEDVVTTEAPTESTEAPEDDTTEAPEDDTTEAEESKKDDEKKEDKTKEDEKKEEETEFNSTDIAEVVKFYNAARKATNPAPKGHQTMALSGDITGDGFIGALLQVLQPAAKSALEKNSKDTDWIPGHDHDDILASDVKSAKATTKNGVTTVEMTFKDQVDGPDKSSGPVERGISTLGSIDSALSELGAEITEGRDTVKLTYTDAYLKATIKDGKITGGTWHYLVKIFVGNAKGKLGISITLKNLKAAVDYKVVI